MSRIAGLLWQAEGQEQVEQVRQMLAAVRSSDEWQAHVHRLAPVVSGWTGRGTPNIVLLKHILLALDGNIYNHQELGEAHSDAELLASLYARYGFPEMLRRLNGDFALALYDFQTDTLWLGRDRFGIRPLYYVAKPGFFAFASRPRSLLSLPGVSPQVNQQFVALFAGSHYRSFDNHPDQSPYAEIAQLPGAHWLQIRNGSLQRGTYWSLQDLPDLTDPEATLAERYRDLLRSAVALRVARASAPAFTLSGGMDSSSVLASAVAFSGARQHAFSTVYVDKTYDETQEIRSMLDTQVTQWHPVAVDQPDVFALVQRMVVAHDEPVATATWLSHFLLCEQAARQGFGSLFGGLGGDELNAGEYEYFFFYFADLRAAGRESQLAHEVQWWAHYHDHPIYRKNQAVVEDCFTRLVDLNQPGLCLPDRRRLTRYAGALDSTFFDLSGFSPIMEHPFQSYLKNRTFQDISRETAPCCLRAEDRQSVAFGLENFLPFFDHRLVEFMFRIPGELKIRDGVTKRLLRSAMRGVLPEETRTRVKKTGWNAPAHVWFSGAGRTPLLDLVHSRSFRERGIYNLVEVERLIAEHDQIVASGEPQENHMMFLWQLVNLEMWLATL